MRLESDDGDVMTAGTVDPEYPPGSRGLILEVRFENLLAVPRRKCLYLVTLKAGMERILLQMRDGTGELFRHGALGA